MEETYGVWLTRSQLAAAIECLAMSPETPAGEDARWEAMEQLQVAYNNAHEE